MKITVTKSDITKAKYLLRRNKVDVAGQCPIACAVKRIKKINDVLVSRSQLHLGCVTPSRVYKLPDKAREFIRFFDHNVPVKPFSFNAPLLRINK